jgi:hypothetical protein
MSAKHIVIAATFASISFSAYGQGVCQNIMTYASRDETEADSSIVTYQSIYKEHCEGSSYSRKNQTDVGLQAVIYSIPVKLDLGTGSSEEKMDKFCKLMAESDYLNKDVHLNSSTVVREALTAFNECVALANKKIYFYPTILKTQIDVDVKRGDEDVSVLGVRYKSDRLKCHVPHTDSEKTTTVADLNTRQLLGAGSYPITCERIPQKQDDGTLDYPSVDLSITTDRGTLAIPVSADAELPTKWASAFSAQQKQLSADIDDIDKRLASIQLGKTVNCAWPDPAKGEGGCDSSCDPGSVVIGGTCELFNSGNGHAVHEMVVSNNKWFCDYVNTGNESRAGVHIHSTPLCKAAP